MQNEVNIGTRKAADVAPPVLRSTSFPQTRESGYSLSLTQRSRRWLVALAVAIGSLIATHPLMAQGCALCYNTAAAASDRGIIALRHGILVLMIPPVLIFGTVCFFTARERNRFNDEANDVGPVIPNETSNLAAEVRHKLRPEGGAGRRP